MDNNHVGKKVNIPKLNGYFPFYVYTQVLNHVIDWDQAKIIDRESNSVDRWTKEAIHIRKEQDKSMNRDDGSYQLSHTYDNLFAPNLSGERRLDRPFRRRLQSKFKRQH